jgi:hypothetical protein
VVSAPCDEYHAVPGVGDGRPSIAEVHRSCDVLDAAGWKRAEIAAQLTETGERLPILGWTNSPDVDTVLIGGIHGREPAGALALAAQAERLRDAGRTRSILLMPLLNPWGYSRHLRYGPSGRSVGDSDHCLGRAAAPACPEAAAITAFVLDAVRVNPGARVLDLHEDPVYEEPAYLLEGDGSYLYLSGEGAKDHPVAARVRRCLESGPFPLLREGATRFGERLVDGVVSDTEDGSIDELLARRRACSPVVTTEIVLRGPADPPLADRVSVYRAVVDAFLGP